MKQYKKTYKEVEEVEFVTCDICGKDIYHETRSSSMPLLTREVTIEYEHGESWPDDGSYYHFRPDICPQCFREKIYPFLLGLLNRESKTWIDDWDKPQYDCMDELDV